MARKKHGGQPPKCKKTKRMGKNIKKDFKKTTIRIYKLAEIKKWSMKNTETFNRYINRLIEEDLLKNGDEKTMINYFEKE